MTFITEQINKQSLLEKTLTEKHKYNCGAERGPGRFRHGITVVYDNLRLCD